MHDDRLFSPVSFSTLIARRGRGETYPVQMVEESLSRFNAVDETVCAFQFVDPDAVRAELLQRRAGPLEGIAIGIKDIFDTHDMPTEYGSAIYAGHRPKADSALVALCRRAGATILGKTVTTEFAFLTPARTRNPHDLERTPGGSSSGSAAAVACGMVPIAFGTQTGGSTIRPAAYCGVAGYKPSYRMLPVTGMKAFSTTLDTVGVFAAHVGDAASFMEKLTNRDLTHDGFKRKTVTVGYYRSAIDNQASQAMHKAVETAANALRRSGNEVIDLEEPGELSLAREAHTTIQNFEANQALAFEADNHRDLLSATLRETLEAGRAILPVDYDEARRIAKRGRDALRSVFQSCDVLLLPSAAGAAPSGLASTGDPLFNKLWTLMGTPAVNIPGLSDEHGLPLGVQMVGRFGNDRLTLNVATDLERLLSPGAAQADRS